jgi:hypothetical protein
MYRPLQFHERGQYLIGTYDEILTAFFGTGTGDSPVCGEFDVVVAALAAVQSQRPDCNRVLTQRFANPYMQSGHPEEGPPWGLPASERGLGRWMRRTFLRKLRGEVSEKDSNVSRKAWLARAAIVFQTNSDTRTA